MRHAARVWYGYDHVIVHASNLIALTVEPRSARQSDTLVSECLITTDNESLSSRDSALAHCTAVDLYMERGEASSMEASWLARSGDADAAGASYAA